MTLESKHSLCTLTNTNSVAWNARLDFSISPNPNNTQIVMWCYLGSWHFAAAISFSADGTENIRFWFCKFEQFCMWRILYCILSFKINAHNLTLWQQQRHQKNQAALMQQTFVSLLLFWFFLVVTVAATQGAAIPQQQNSQNNKLHKTQHSWKRGHKILWHILG